MKYFFTLFFFFFNNNRIKILLCVKAAERSLDEKERKNKEIIENDIRIIDA